MDGILEELGLNNLSEAFESNSITPAVVLKLTEDEFKALGVETIGDRVRLRERCRDHTTASDFPEESPVMKRLRSLQTARKGRSKRSGIIKNNRKPKDTRRIVAGWKHFQNGTYRQMYANKGGGSLSIDVQKAASLENLKELLLNKYFPDGTNVQSGIQLEDVDHYVASFTGNAISQYLKNGQQFTLGGYVEDIKSTPVRLYLHTKLRSSGSETPEIAAEDITLTSNRNTDSNGNRNTDSPVTDAQTEELASSFNSDLEDLATSDTETQENFSVVTVPSIGTNTTDSQTSTAGAQSENQSSPFNSDVQLPGTSNSSHQCISSDSSDFEELDTPTIAFRRRSRLRLRRSRPHTDTSVQSVEVDNVQCLEDGPLDFSMSSILRWWIKNTRVSGDYDPQLLLVNRAFILKSTLRVVNRETYDLRKEFNVSFSGEDGDDLGGPKREFFRLLLSEVTDNIFQGEPGNKFFTHDIEKLAKGDYETAGKLVGFSLLHGGPGLPVINRAVYEYMTDRDISKCPGISECIFEEDARRHMEKIHETKTQEEYDNAITESTEWCSEKGLSVYGLRKFEDKENLLHHLIKNEIIYSVHTEIDQFTKGLNKIGRLFDAILMAPQAFEELFCLTLKPLNFPSFRALYDVIYSEEGSNNKRLEQQAVYCLEAFLADCEGGASGVTLQEVLAFWTGATRPPPLGFPKRLEISFGAAKQLPTAHTCGMELNIWRGYSDPDNFQEDMTKAIRWSGGFHLA